MDYKIHHYKAPKIIKKAKRSKIVDKGYYTKLTW